ncbi:MAG: Fic family protein [Planctomycetes bacterium]|nr:Fic family protein [Planctomycetota bacterium]MCB9903261.1 Fic family protein [Planctomycetota bacterium]
MTRIFALQLKSPQDGAPYLHWDELRHRDPPEGYTHEEWWYALKLARGMSYRPMPLLDKSGEPFVISSPDRLFELATRVDREASGAIELSEDVRDPDRRDKYVADSLFEEAITSSQLEGAATTRKAAKEMLRAGRRPTTHGERMILANYRAMERIRDLRSEPLSPDLILELHSIVTAETLPPGESGRLRRADEDVRVTWDDIVLHDPPPADELPRRLEALCRFANGEIPERYVHPAIRAAVVHFWLAYDHPFTDGNGRTARGLFYWSLLHEGYWLAEYLSVSRLLRRAPASYARAFLYTETDGNDLTYFVDYQLEVVLRSIGQLRQYLEREMRKARETEKVLRPGQGFNHRQVAILSRALRKPGARFTIASHQNSHGIAYATSRADLQDLARRGLLDMQRDGRRQVFRAPEDLQVRIANSSDSR